MRKCRRIRAVRAFGDKVLEVIEARPNRLREVLVRLTFLGEELLSRRTSALSKSDRVCAATLAA